MNKTSTDQPKIGSPYKLQNGHTIKVVDLEQSGVLFQLLLPGQTWSEVVDQCTWEEWNEMAPEKLGVEGKLAQSGLDVKFLEASRLDVGGNPLLWVEVVGYGDVNFIRQGGLGFWAGSIRPRLSQEEQKELDQKLDAMWEEHGKNAKQATRKLAVDAETKDYFTSYFKAYGASLTRDLAFKKAAAKVAQSADGFGNLIHQNGQWMLDDPSFPMKTDLLLVKDQNKADYLAIHGKTEGVPYRAVPFGKALILDDQAMVGKLAQSEGIVFVKDVPEFEILSGDKYSVVPSSDPAQVMLHGDIGNKSGMGTITLPVAKLEEFEQDGLTLQASAGPHTAQVVEVPNQWAQIAENIWECDYASGAHGAVESTEGRFLATCIEADGQAHEKDFDTLGAAELFCDSFTKAEPNMVAKSATQTLKSLQASDKLQALIAERTASGDAVEALGKSDDHSAQMPEAIEMGAALDPSVEKEARAAINLGRKISLITKEAVDAETISYWSEYFGQYGMQFVRPLAFKKAARQARSAGDWDADDMAWYEKELEKQKKEEDGKTAQTVEGAQTVYDVAISVKAEPFVTLLPDAFEQTLKFALEATKPEGAAHVVVDSVLADIQGESMTGHAACAVTLTTEDMAAFLATMKSQLAAYMQEADFPCSVVTVSSPVKRTAGQDCIISDARLGVPYVRLVSLYGAERARVARRCAEREAAGIKYSAKARFLVKHAQAMIESHDATVFEGDANSELGSWADLGDGLRGQIKFIGTKLPDAFQWIITDGGDRVLEKGDEETFEQAKGEVQSRVPEAKTKLSKEEASAKLAIQKECGPVSAIEHLSHMAGVSEYRVALKSGKVTWVTLRAGQVENKVGEV